jgi:hypothetical protein
MRWFIIAAILLIVGGGGCIVYAESFPVYSDEHAPSRIADELESLSRDTRFKEWYSRLRSFETPHKRFSDVGRGLCAAGVGLLASTRLWTLYHRWPRTRSVTVLLALWSALWLMRIPFTFWYYSLRQQRSDYPWWGDTIVIRIASESFSWVIGAVVSSVILRLFLIGYRLPATIRLVRPVSPYGWFRTVFIGCWLAILGEGAFWGVFDGDEGTVLTSTIASVILLVFLSALLSDRRPRDPPPDPDQPDASPQLAGSK